MSAPLPVAKIIIGAFLIPWWNRRVFARALALPLAAFAGMSIGATALAERLSTSGAWLLYVLHFFLAVLIAVPCHRLILVSATAANASWLPGWSRREWRFLLWTLAIYALFFLVQLAGIVVFGISMIPFSHGLESAWADEVSLAARIPPLYVLGRLCPILPATAIDRPANQKWAWTLTAGNDWRLLLIVGALPWAIGSVIALLYRSDPTVFETVALSCLATVLVTVEIAAISLSYQELTRHEVSTSQPAADS